MSEPERAEELPIEEGAGQAVEAIEDDQLVDEEQLVDELPDEAVSNALRVIDLAARQRLQRVEDARQRTARAHGRVDDLARYTPPREVGPVLIPEHTGPRKNLTPPPLQAPQEYARRVIPEGFDEATWESLADLVNDDDAPSLGTVETVDGRRRRVRGAEAVRELRARFAKARKVVVLLGETRAGKSLVAAAALRAEILAGNFRAGWMHALELKEPGAIERALGYSTLVLDDLGYELNGAKANSGWLPGYTGPACEFLARWYGLRGRRLIVTTFLEYTSADANGRARPDDPPGMAELYGAGAAARVYQEGAQVIRLFRE
jgi:hypothetical protein